MSNRTSVLSTILDAIKAKVNDLALRHMMDTGSFDPAVALSEMRDYGYETLGEYIGNNMFRKMERFI